MTVDGIDSDPDLEYHNAVTLEHSGQEQCHAVVSDYTSSPHDYKTECGTPIEDWSDTATRIKYADNGIPMCPDCWPDRVVSDGGSE